MPLISADLRLGERMRVQTVLPALLEFDAHVSSWLDVGFRGAMRGNRFHLDETKYGADNVELAYSVITMGPTMTLSPSPLVHIDLYTAVALNRRLELFVDKASRDDGMLETAPVYGIRVWLGGLGWETPKASDAKE